MTEDSTRDAWKRAFRDSSPTKEQEPEQRLNSLSESRRLFYEELAKASEAPLNAVIAEMDRGDLESRRALASWANERLRSLGLTVRCPRTGRPGILVVDTRDPNDTVGRYRIEVREPSGRMIRTVSARALPHLALMEDSPRSESFSRSFRRPSGDGPDR